MKKPEHTVEEKEEMQEITKLRGGSHTLILHSSWCLIPAFHCSCCYFHSDSQYICQHWLTPVQAGDGQEATDLSSFPARHQKWHFFTSSFSLHFIFLLPSLCRGFSQFFSPCLCSKPPNTDLKPVIKATEVISAEEVIWFLWTLLTRVG